MVDTNLLPERGCWINGQSRNLCIFPDLANVVKRRWGGDHELIADVQIDLKACVKGV